MPKSVLTAIYLFIAFVLLLVVGASIFYAIEHPEEIRIHQRNLEVYELEQMAIFNILNKHNFTGVDTDADTWELIHRLQEYQFGFGPRPEYINQWSFNMAVFFSFTIITTIGYGTFVPQTRMGRGFVLIYGLIGIPIAGFSLGFFAERVLYVFTWLSKLGSDTVLEAFQAFDQDGSGELEEDEFKEAIKMLGIEIKPTSFKKFWSQIDTDGGGTVDLDEFRDAVKLMHADVTETAGQKNKIINTAVGLLFWILLGVVVFVFIEDNWTFFHSFYFVMITLFTIGLGDFAPDTNHGALFLIVFCMVGLGLVAVLISLVQLMVSELDTNKLLSSKTDSPSESKKESLLSLTIFSRLSEEKFNILNTKMISIEFAQNVNIIRQNHEMDVYYVLVSGTVTIHKLNSHDKHYVSSPSFLLYNCIPKNSNICIADATVTAEEKIEVLSIARTDWEEVIAMDESEVKKSAIPFEKFWMRSSSDLSDGSISSSSMDDSTIECQ